MQFFKHTLSKMKIFLLFVDKFRNSFKKLKKKTHLLAKFPGVPVNMPFLIPNIFNKGKILEMF